MRSTFFSGRYICILLSVLLIGDLAYSFLQYYHQPLDGDMAWNLLPSPDVAPIFKSPFGLDAIFGERLYANPNRYFGHWLYREYLLNTPVFLQNFLSPIDSVYMACAIAKIITHLLLVFLLTVAITGKFSIINRQCLFIGLLCTVFFQANGYRDFMGVIDPSTTFTFFYALPSIYLILLLLPAILYYVHGKLPQVSPIRSLCLLLLVMVVSLSGPLNPAIILVIGLLYGVYILRQLIVSGWEWNILNSNPLPRVYNFIYLFAVFFAGYSLYLGKFNLTSHLIQNPIMDSYSRLPYGIYYQFSQKLGFPLLFLTIIINYILIRRFADFSAFQKYRNLLFWIAAFSITYILLLPLGGFRPYRPHILRYDTILPITLGLIFLLGISTTFVVQLVHSKLRNAYILVIAAVILVFTLADEPKFDGNACERAALEKLSVANSEIVKLSADCSVVDWRPITDPEKSEANAELIYRWGITDRVRLYYQE